MLPVTALVITGGCSPPSPSRTGSGDFRTCLDFAAEVCSFLIGNNPETSKTINTPHRPSRNLPSRNFLPSTSLPTPSAPTLPSTILVYYDQNLPPRATTVSLVKPVADEFNLSEYSKLMLTLLHRRTGPSQNRPASNPDKPRKRIKKPHLEQYTRW